MNFLIGKFILKDLPTQYLYEDYDANDKAKKPQIRVSVGWRNPQEDAYDVTSMTIEFTPDGKVLAKCVDGYSNGSISTQYYNPDSIKPYWTQKW